MHAAPSPSAADSRCIACFDALMWALSRPGLPRDLPASGVDGLIEALLDRECAAFSDNPAAAEAIARTGAACVPLEAADHVFVDRFDTQTLRRLRQGSDLHPEDGATLVTQARIGHGPRLRLSGPGIDGHLEIALELPPEIWAIRREIMRYPMGFEMFVLDGAQVIGLPRSTQVEVI
ncbi:phosphonate C-P lyase system protein PhnH [Sagittula sp. SSi028]|uniref:phosphonate C-P lyase system protein PhnH n=1 Tax=Sagittula sp. SSi028 TaxID=3400636 RepID=UPI003AF5424E